MLLSKDVRHKDVDIVSYNLLLDVAKALVDALTNFQDSSTGLFITTHVDYSRVISK